MTIQIMTTKSDSEKTTMLIYDYNQPIKQFSIKIDSILPFSIKVLKFVIF